LFFRVVSEIYGIFKRFWGRTPEPKVGDSPPPSEAPFVDMVSQMAGRYQDIQVRELENEYRYPVLRDTFHGAYVPRDIDVTTPFGKVMNELSSSENEMHYQLSKICVSSIRSYYTDKVEPEVLNDVVRLQTGWDVEIGSRSLYEPHKLVEHMEKYAAREPVDRLSIKEGIMLHMSGEPFPSWEFSNYIEKSWIPSGSNSGFPFMEKQSKKFKQFMVEELWPLIRAEFFILVEKVLEYLKARKVDFEDPLALADIAEDSEFIETVEPWFTEFLSYWIMFTRTQRVPGDNKSRVVQGASVIHKLIMLQIWKPIIKMMIGMEHFLYGPPEKFNNEVSKIVLDGGLVINIDFTGHEQAVTYKRHLTHMLWWATGLRRGSVIRDTVTERRFKFRRKIAKSVPMITYYFCVALFNYFDAQTGIIISPTFMIEGFPSGLKSGNMITSGAGSSETRLYVKSMLSRSMIIDYLKVIKKKKPIPKIINFPYCDMGDDLLVALTPEWFNFWNTTFKTPEWFRGKPGDPLPEKVSILDSFLEYWHGAVVNLPKSDILVPGHGMILKKQGFMSSGVLQIQGLVGPIINSLSRLERDSSIFNSELFREMFEVPGGKITETEALILRYIAVLYNIRDGPYLRILVAALIVGDTYFSDWVKQNEEERYSLFEKIRIKQADWRIASQSDWDVFVIRLETTLSDVIQDLENRISEPVARVKEMFQVLK
jgi:hypothetical protein